MHNMQGGMCIIGRSWISGDIHSILLAAAFILAAIAATGIFRYMEGPPRGVHQWRQTDCASIALNYFQDSPGFFHPQEHNLTGENGATVSEFPVLYYLDAQLYRLFGPHELIMRLVNLCSWWQGFGTCTGLECCYTAVFFWR